MVLTYIGGHGHAHALHGQGEHLADLLTGSLGGYRGTAQQVDGVLHDDGANGRDGILKAHGKADVGQPLTVPGGEQAALTPERELLLLGRPGKEPERAQPAAEQLAEDGGNGRAVHAHAHGDDEQVIQPDVQHAGRQQEIERVLGVAHGAEHAGSVVVQHRGRDAQEDDPDVEHGVRVQLFRRVDELKQRARHQGGEDGEHHAQHHAEQGTVEQVLPQAALILGTEGLGYRDAKAHAGTLHKAQDEEVERVGGAYRAQCVGAQAPAHNDGVRKAVQLLEQGAQHQRQRKPQNLEQRLAHRKVRGARLAF